jgi:hypothetical protein
LDLEVCCNLGAIVPHSIPQVKTALDLLQRDIRELLLEPLGGQMVIL